MAERFLNPETQFLDSSGKPRVNGKLAFHENGTLIDKDTFKDVNLTPALINANPLLLTADGRIPNCFYAGTARVIGTDDSGQFMDKDNVGISGTGAAFDTFNSVTTYELGAIVVASDEEIYRSLQNNNQGNDPTSSPAFWEQVQFVGTFNVNITYADDDLVQASDGQLYRSIQAANLNNEPSASPTFWRNASADQDLDTGSSVEHALVKVADGTAALPSRTFKDDLDIGWFRIGANNIGMALGGLKVIDYADGIYEFIDNADTSAVGPIFNLHRFSASPANADFIATLQWTGMNDAAQKVTYASIFAQIDDVADGSEDGTLVIATMVAGTLTPQIDISSAVVAFTPPIDINGGNIDGTTIGASAVAAGSFAAIIGTTCVLSGDLTVNGNDINFGAGGGNAPVLRHASNNFDIINATGELRTVNNASTVVLASIKDSGGMIIGSPTGGNQGAGTLNATGVFDDGVLLTCYVFEAAQGKELVDSFWHGKAPDRLTKGFPARRRQVIKKSLVEELLIEMIDGVPVQKTGTVEISKRQYKSIGVVDETGKPVPLELEPAIQAQPALYDKDQKLVREAVKAKPAVIGQLMYDDPIMEDVAAGEDIIEKQPHFGYDKFKARLGTKTDPLDIDKYAAHWKTKGHLTAMPNEQNFDVENGMAMGKWIQRLLETVEIQAVHIEQLNQRLKVQENA